MRQNMEHGKKKLATRSISVILALVFIFSIFFLVGEVFAKKIIPDDGLCPKGGAEGNCYTSISSKDPTGPIEPLTGYYWQGSKDHKWKMLDNWWWGNKV